MKKQKRRKAVNPMDNPLVRAVVAAKVKTEADFTSVQIANLQAMADARAGRLGKHALQVLGAVAAVSERLAARGIGPEAMPAVLAARRVLAAIGASGGAVAPEQAAVLGELHEYHEAQVQSASLAEYAAALAPFCRLAK